MKILVINDRESWDVAEVQQALHGHEVIVEQHLPESFDLVSVLAQHADADWLVTGYADLSAKRLAQLPKLQGIQTTTTAVEYIDLAYCQAHDIQVKNVAGYTATAVAEHLLALMLAVGRRLPHMDKAVKAGDFEQFDQVGFEFYGKTLGILGMGHIGQAFASMASALGMQVQFYNRSKKALAYPQCDLPELLASSDVLALTLPLTPQTRHLLDESALAKVKPGSLLVSIAADAVVDQNALLAALQDGRLAGAGLDLHHPQSALYALDQVVLTPTKAWYTRECQARRQQAWLTAVQQQITEVV